MSTDKLTLALVGAHFHPPAKTLLEVLPAGTPLELRPVPENPYDPNAVMVMLPAAFAAWLHNYEHGAGVMVRLEERLPEQGCTYEQLLSTLPMDLCYLGASDGKPLAKLQAEPGMPPLSGNKELLELVRLDGVLDQERWDGLQATLSFSPAGTPLVEVSWPE